jgi:membrane protease YdiL (CAAX protease family)
VRVAVAFLLLYLVLDRLASVLGSTRGEAGLVVSGAVLLLAIAAERWISGAPTSSALRALGLGAPSCRSLLASAALCAALLAALPVLAARLDFELRPLPGAAWLAIGMFAQGGIAEELLFRGFAYRHLRRGRAFWPAAGLSLLPFTAAHLPLFASFEPAVAALALAMSILWAFPLAWLFDRADGSIWPGALLHAVIQGAIKLVEPGDPGEFRDLAIAWLALGLVAPWLFFLVRERRPDREPTKQGAARAGTSGRGTASD